MYKNALHFKTSSATPIFLDGFEFSSSFRVEWCHLQVGNNSGAFFLNFSKCLLEAKKCQFWLHMGDAPPMYMYTYVLTYISTYLREYVRM